MSGPKTSRYTLTAAQRRALAEQIKREQERILRQEMKRVERELLVSQCQNLERELNRVITVVEQIESTVRQGELKPVDLSTINNAINRAKEALNKAKNRTNASLEELKADNNTLKSASKEIYKATEDAHATLKQQEKELRDTTLSRLSEVFDISFEGITNRKALKQNEYIPRILEALEEISLLTLSDKLREKLEKIRLKSAEIKDVGFLSNYYSISVLPFLKECKKYDELWAKYGEEYSRLKIRYTYLCKELDCEVENVDFDENAVSELLSRISKLEEEQIKRSEEAYICKCIDEAMVELGYSVVGTREVTKKNGKHFRNELYKFAEGTVVNVTYADDGQITMELGAVDSVDRTPTDAESRGLVEDMTNFCSDYSELEKKLKKKGVEPKRIAILPPHAEYAQIIDISDYDMTEPVGEYHRKKTASSGANVLHKGE